MTDCSSPSDRPSRDDRLVAYSAAAAGAILALSPTAADAQVVYTDLDPDTPLVTGDDLLIDFDGDDNGDLLFTVDNPFKGFFRARVVSDDANNGGVAGFGPVAANYNYFYASVLNLGDVVSDENVVQNTNVSDSGANRDDFLLASTFNGSGYGDWAGAVDKYLGVRFTADVGGQETTHYAWVRLDVTDATDIVVKDYAFEQTPDTPIEAGDMGTPNNTAVDPDALTDGYRFTAIAPNPVTGVSQFDVSVGRTESVRVEVFDALGRRVRVLHHGPLAGGQSRTFAIDGGDLPSGLYAVRVTGESFDTTRTLSIVR